MPDSVVVEAVGLGRTYPPVSGNAPTVVGLLNVSLRVGPGEVLAVTGPSGSGKSTLLFLLSGLDAPDTGSVRVQGVDWTTLSGRRRAEFRRDNTGFIAQGTSLLPQATASENVEVPLLLSHVGSHDRRPRVAAALERVGLADHASKLPDQLSGGQQQRVAIARALVHSPALVVADEPTASLDSDNAQDVTRLLVACARAEGAAVVLVTHDPDVARHADRVLELRSGMLASSTGPT